MLKESVLHRLWENADGREIKKKLVAPFALHTERIKQLHSSDYDGHLGVAKFIRKDFTGQDVEKMWKNIVEHVTFAIIEKDRVDTRNQARVQQFNVLSPREETNFLLFQWIILQNGQK